MCMNSYEFCVCNVYNVNLNSDYHPQLAQCLCPFSGINKMPFVNFHSLNDTTIPTHDDKIHYS